MKAQQKRGMGLLVLTLLIGLGLGERARGRETPGEGEAMGTGSVAAVDINRAYNVSGFPAELSQRELSLNSEAKSRYDALIALQPAFLEPNELQELLSLAGKPTLTDAEKKRLADLKALAAKRAADAQALLAKPQDQLSATDRQTLDKNTARQRNFETQFAPTIQSEFLNQVRLGVDLFREEQVNKIRVEVGKLAKERKIAHVFDRQVLVYSTSDLTDDLIQRLNRKREK